MTWFKVDDKLHDHRKVRRAGMAAMGLWAVAGSWAADNLTDGFVPAEILSRWASDASKLAAKLVAAGLWFPDEQQGERGYSFAGWEDWQPSRKQVEADRHAARERQQRARDRATQARESRSRHAVTGAVTHAEVTPDVTDTSPRESRSPRPDPSRPVPTSVLKNAPSPSATTAQPPPADAVGSTSKIPTELAGFEDFWAAYPRRSGKDDARKAWITKGCERISPQVIASATRYRDDPNREASFTKHPATWLRAGCWDDDPLPPRSAPITRGQAEQERVDTIFANGLEWARDADTGDQLALENGRPGRPLRVIGGDW